MPETPSNFCTGEWSELQFAWDSTSFREAMTCWRRYYYRIVKGYVRDTAKWDLDWGRYYHIGMDALHTGIAKGLDRDAALVVALRMMMMTAGDSPAEGDRFGKRMRWKPWDPDPEWRHYNKKNRSTLIRALIWYCEALPPEDAPPVVFEDGTIATELSFRIPLARRVPDDGYAAAHGDLSRAYVLCGHFDGLARYGAETFIRESKTTKSTIGSYYFDQFKPNVQIDIYALAASVLYPDTVSGILIEACQTAVGFTRFDREPIRHTPARLDEIAVNLTTLIAQAEINAKSGYWPMNTTACDQYGGCPYRPVCRKSPSLRQKFLDDGIGKVRYIKDPWNPLEER